MPLLPLNPLAYLLRSPPTHRVCEHTLTVPCPILLYRTLARFRAQILKAGSRPSLTTIKSVIRSKSKLSQIAVESRSRLRASSRVNYGDGDGDGDGDEWLQAKDPVKPHDQVSAHDGARPPPNCAEPGHPLPNPRVARGAHGRCASGS